VILAEDEASLYLQATTRAVWAPKGQTPVTRVHPGREMTHFYGVLNLQTGQEIARCADALNAGATAAYLKEILAAIPDQPILLLGDRGPCHSGPPLRELLAANPRLETLALPVASPDLNPQEHVWKAARQAALHNHAIPHRAGLTERFEGYLNCSVFPSSLLDHYGFNPISPMFK